MRLQKIPSICRVISKGQVSPAEVTDIVWQYSHCILLSILHSAGILCRALFLLTGPDIWPRTRLWFLCLPQIWGWCGTLGWHLALFLPSICSHCLERTFLSSLVNSVTWSGLSSGTLPLSCSIDYVSVGGDLTLLTELRPNWQAEEEWVLGLQSTSAALWMKSLVSLKQKK